VSSRAGTASGAPSGGRWRARLVALYLVAAGLLGGGGLYFPAQELALELLFAGIALACLWWRRAAGSPAPDAVPVYAICGLVLSIPVLQLVPLPPAVWQSLPGREDALAALRLVGAVDTWRPVSLVPANTLACLLSLVPPLGLLVLASQLDLRDRRLILYVAAVLALASTALGAGQLLAPDGSLNLYSNYYAGWITGFQVGRNSAADVFLAGLLAVAAIARLAMIGKIWRSGPSQSSGRILGLAAAVGILLTVAVVMTGSRTGVIHLVLAAAGSLMIFSVGAGGGSFARNRTLAVVGICALALAGLTYLSLPGEASALDRVWRRFAMLEDNRTDVWQLAMAAWHAYWPVGVGRGGYIEAVVALEPLETLGPSWPNRAHNEYIEIGIEAGIAAYVVLAAVLACLAWVARRKWREDESREARIQLIYGASVLILLGSHSVVDFPLRGMSLACIAAAACGLLTRAPGRKSPSTGPRSASVQTSVPVIM